MLRRPVESGQYTSIAFTERLAAATTDASVGSLADAYDNALAESTIGLFKTELIKPGGPWRSCDQVEIATLEYVDWYNHRRLHSGAADLPPAVFETLHQPTNPASPRRRPNLFSRYQTRGGSTTAWRRSCSSVQEFDDQ